MKRTYLGKVIAVCCYLLLCSSLMAQVAEVKKFNQFAGKARLIGSSTEMYKNAYPSSIFEVEILSGGAYYLKAIAAFEANQNIIILIDGQHAGELASTGNGFQLGNGNFFGNKQVNLSRGKHQVIFMTKTDMAPIISEISLSDTYTHSDIEKKWAVASRLLQAAALQPLEPIDKRNDGGTRFLANPAGNYWHDIEEKFSYTTFQWVYLTGGTTEVFSTSGSTYDPVLMLFDPNNIDVHSWANDDYNGIESYLKIDIPATGWYVLTARTYNSGSGITNIYRNGSITHTNAPIGGRRLFVGTTNATTLNYFTSHLTAAAGTTPDTRIFAMSNSISPAMGYNDDYATTGDWNWGYASRIKKTFTSTPYTAFVSAYGLTTTGTCDIYGGAATSTVPPYFANFKDDDAMRSGNASGTYNCISWSGGVTTAWHWPIYSTSIYYNVNPTTAFDNFYSNTPAIRYSGAWNYSRTGANVNNAVVDLWAFNGTYTHGSVKKPGNNQPHGYDWESKTGSLDRSFHPRNALSGGAPAYYGNVVSYYINTGTFAPRLGGPGGLATDIDAIKAGMDVTDKAALSQEALKKLEAWGERVSPGSSQVFDKLYQAWKNTWQDNAAQSDPGRYCQNGEYKALLNYCRANKQTVLPLFFKQYLQGSAICDPLLCDLTLEKYGHLLEEVKKEYLANPYDKQGRHIINNQYCNGIRYIEKILEQTNTGHITGNQPGFKDGFTVKLSPNPVKDALLVQLELNGKATVTIQVINTQTGAVVLLQKEASFAPGNHRITGHIGSISAMPGTLLTVQVTVNGIVNTYKLQAGN